MQFISNRAFIEAYQLNPHLHWTVEIDKDLNIVALSSQPDTRFNFDDYNFPKCSKDLTKYANKETFDCKFQAAKRKGENFTLEMYWDVSRLVAFLIAKLYRLDYPEGSEQPEHGIYYGMLYVNGEQKPINTVSTPIVSYEWKTEYRNSEYFIQVAERVTELINPNELAFKNKPSEHYRFVQRDMVCQTLEPATYNALLGAILGGKMLFSDWCDRNTFLNAKMKALEELTQVTLDVAGA